MSRFPYFAPLVDFLHDIDGGGLADRLAARHVELMDAQPGDAERQSWAASLPALANVLRAPEFATADIFVELFMPLNGRRCDALLTGHSEKGPSAVVVELKQWSFVKPSHLSEHVMAGNRNVLHPAVQVRDYVERLRHFHSAFTDGAENPIALHGVAYLHGLAPTGDKADLRTTPSLAALTDEFPLFFSHEQRLLAQWLANRLVPGPGKFAAERIRTGRPLPSPKLLDRLVECIKGQKDWQLLDEQKTAYASIRNAVQKARLNGHRQVFVVRGGPGTGKSVLAIQLLADAARAHWKVAHATGSKAFQTVLQARTEAFSLDMMKRIHSVTTKKALPVAGMFATFAEVAKLGANDPWRLDIVVCDEAHRLWQHRRQKFPNGMVRWLSDTYMVDEVIQAANVTVFFLDDNQAVRAGEIGHSSMILERCRALGLPYEIHDLDAQFRCAGSSSYVHWIDGLLNYRASLDHEWKTDNVYDLQIWKSMPAMDKHLRQLASENRRCRLLAGYCWRWTAPDGLGKLPLDLVDPRFEGWEGSWIAKTGLNLAPMDHRYYTWATLDSSYEEVGSIYSAQGFEFDDVGVIWGEDLVWRGDRWVANLSVNRDGAFKRELRTSGADPIDKLRNVYRVLLTRGMRSTHLFILDDETREHVAACLVPVAKARALAVNDVPTADSKHRQLRLITQREFRPIEVQPAETSPWQDGVPVMDFHAAAGGFSRSWTDLLDLTAVERWVNWPDSPRFQPGDFVALVRGESMSPEISDGDWCLFRPAPVEAAEGRPALVRLLGDSDDGAQFTVKVVRIERRLSADGHYVPVAMVLESRNPSFPPMRFESDGQRDVTVLATVVQVLGRALGDGG